MTKKEIGENQGDTGKPNFWYEILKKTTPLKLTFL